MQQTSFAHENLEGQKSEKQTRELWLLRPTDPIFSDKQNQSVS